MGAHVVDGLVAHGGTRGGWACCTRGHTWWMRLPVITDASKHWTEHTSTRLTASLMATSARSFLVKMGELGSKWLAQLRAGQAAPAAEGVR